MFYISGVAWSAGAAATPPGRRRGEPAALGASFAPPISPVMSPVPQGGWGGGSTRINRFSTGSQHQEFPQTKYFIPRAKVCLKTRRSGAVSTGGATSSGGGAGEGGGGGSLGGDGSLDGMNPGNRRPIRSGRSQGSELPPLGAPLL